MICCKISANYNNVEGNFANLLNDLAKVGDVLWENNYLYFSNTTSEKVKEKKVASILKKNNYNKFFIEEFTKEEEPHESERIKGWIAEKLAKIFYKQYEEKSQELFRNINKGLDMLEEEIEMLKQKKQKLLEEAEEENGG